MENKLTPISAFLQEYLLNNDPELKSLPENTMEMLGIQLIFTQEAPRKLLLDCSSEPFINALKSYCSELLGKPISTTLDMRLKYIAKTEKKLIKLAGSYTLPSNGRKAFDFFKLDSLRELDNSYEAFNILMRPELNKKKRPKGLENYEKYYFDYLSKNNYPPEYVLRSYIRLFDFKEDQNPGFYYRFLNEMSLKRLKDTYVFAMGTGEVLNQGLIAGILTAISLQAPADALEYSKALLDHNPTEALQAFSLFNSMAFSELDDIFQNIKACKIENETAARAFSIIMARIIMHSDTPAAMRKSVLKIIATLVADDNAKIAEAALWVISYEIMGYENERYSLFRIYLGNTKNLKVLSYFFNTFNSSEYLFDLMIRVFEIAKIRFNIEVYGHALSHFWSKNPDATEQHILKLFEYAPAYSILGVKIILSNYSRPYSIDLLKLNDGAQINAIIAICTYPHSIEKLLRPLLSLRNSPFEQVITTLQDELAMLIKEAYHDILYEKITKIVGQDNSDLSFLVPLKEALDQYHEIRSQKEVCKEFDPMLNEKKYIDLYYGLEHEAHAKAMKDFDKGDNSWLSSFKNTTIVRGKAWKTDGDDKILPLSQIQTSILVDSRAYKNPPAYERMLDNLKWK